MDELFSFIKSLKDVNNDNINEYYERLSELIEIIDVRDAKKYRDNNGYGFEFNNIYITVQRDIFEVNIIILINYKYMAMCNNFVYYCILDYKNISDIVDYFMDENGEYLWIGYKNYTEVKNGSIDWLLNHEMPKSARKII